MVAIEKIVALLRQALGPTLSRGHVVAEFQALVRSGLDPTIPENYSRGAQNVLDFIDAELAAERPVYVHCFGGIGRTGTVVGCWMIRHGLASKGDVTRVLARLRLKDVERAPGNPRRTRSSVVS
jgi:protein tyrosine phosphatase